MTVGTQSGAQYEVTDDTITRIKPGRLGGDPHVLRRDGDPITVQAWVQEPVVHKPMIMALEPLGEGAMTVRTTSPVVWIRHYPEEE